MKDKNNIFLKILILLAAIIVGGRFAANVHASEITEYTNEVIMTKDGAQITKDTTVISNEALEVTSNFAFPDSQAISSGDTLTFALPKELTLITPLNFQVFDVVNDKGEVVGSAKQIQQLRQLRSLSQTTLLDCLKIRKCR